MPDELKNEIDKMLGLGDEKEEEKKNENIEVLEEKKDEEEKSTNKDNSDGGKVVDEDGKDSDEDIKDVIGDTPDEEIPKDENSEKEFTESDVDETREDLLARIEKLTSRIENLSDPSYLQNQQKEIPVDGKKKKKENVEKEKEEKGDEEDTEDESDERGFLGGFSVDDVLDSEENLEKVLRNVYSKAIEVANEKVYEKVLMSMPEIVLGHINRSTMINEMVGDFYNVNSDLVPVKRTVAAVANELHSQNPDWNLERVFKEAAPKAREVLGMKKLRSGKKDMTNPAFAKGGKGKAGKKAKVSSLQGDIDELMGFN